MNKVRNEVLDVAKGICISLMVVGHSGCPTWLHDLVYMFHMPCFFVISGWLLKEQYLTDLKLGFARKVRGIYWPFVKWALFFLLMHNVLTALKVYRVTYTGQQWTEGVWGALSMTKVEELLLGFWFLVALFWASLFSMVLLALLKRKGLLAARYRWWAVVVIVAAACLFHRLPVVMPAMFREPTILATAFFLTGYNLKGGSWICGRKAIAWLLVPIGAASCTYLFMDESGWRCGLYYVIALAGTIGVMTLSNVLTAHAVSRRVLAFVGRRSLSILVFHLLAFKLVSLVYIAWHELPMERLAEMPVLSNSDGELWMAYSAAGIALPLLLIRK